MDFTNLGKQQKNTIDYQCIVVYDKSTKSIAKSLHNQAIEQQIKSTTWSKKEYLDQESRLTNYNHIVFLSKYLIEKNLANPKLEPKTVIPGILYKHEGNSLGLYLDSKANMVEMAKEVGLRLKEDWLYKVSLIADQFLILSIIRFFNEKKKAEIYLTFRGVDKFCESLLKDFVSDKLR